MIEVHENINKILKEIEPQENSTTTQKKLTAVDIARKILSQTADGRSYENCINKEEREGDGNIENGANGLIEIEELETPLQEVNNQWELKYYRPILSHRPVLGKFIVKGKRIFRRVAKFLIEPLVLTQAAFNSAVARSLNALRNHSVVFESQIRMMETQIETLRTENERILKVINREDLAGKIDYFDFENQFRGSRDVILENQKHYVEYYKQCERVLDLGSGRGEFLELLKQNDIPAIGIDLYEPFVEFCRMRGLEAKCDNAITYIKKQKAASCDGIFAGQLIEHLPTVDLIELCMNAYRILSKDGILIMETPNPTCVSTYLNSFYLDPSHIKPVHPKTVEYFLRKAGFQNIEILFTEQSKVGYHFPLLEVEAQGNLEEYNNGVNFLSDIIFGSQDYAVIAKK